jgi:hypothetical protein
MLHQSFHAMEGVARGLYLPDEEVRDRAMRKRCSLIVVLSAMVLAGCSSTNSMLRAHKAPSGVSPMLVTTGETNLAAGPVEQGQAMYRNDAHVVQNRAIPDYTTHYWLEIRHREHLRTISGRPREFTTTRSRSIERSYGQR